jgi:hypothetical protein
MDPAVWGATYWDFLHTVAAHYPKFPTATDKKVHYRLIYNFHFFIPNRAIGAEFEKLLDKNPLTPFLDSRDHFVRWVNHVHNVVNEKLGKPRVTLAEHKTALREKYNKDRVRRFLKQKYWLVYAVFLVLILLAAFSFKSYHVKTGP